jgi:hypothetical protein
MAIEDLLIQTCTIQRKTTVLSGGRGKSTVTWSNVATNVKCNVQMETIVREEYQLQDRGERSYTSFTGYFEFGTDIKEGDKVVLSGGQEFHVDRGPNPDTVGHSHHIECDLELIRGV